MSVSIFVTKYDTIEFGWGRAQANWLANHLEMDAIIPGDSCRVYVRADQLKEQLTAARKCGGCDFFSGEDNEPDMKLHRAITKQMAKDLSKLLKEHGGERGDWVDLEICW